MPISDIVNITITANTQTPTRPGFGTPLVAVYTTLFAARTVEVTSLTDVTDLGFAVTHPAYLALAKVFSQNPRPQKAKIGRRALPSTQSFKLKALDATPNEGYAFTLTGSNGVKHAIAYTVPTNVVRVVTNVSVAASAVVTTSVDHGLTSGDSVVIAAVTDAGGSSPINGTRVVTVLTSTTFSVPVTTTQAYVSGGTVTKSSTVSTVAADINVLITAASITGLASNTRSADTITLTSTQGSMLNYLADLHHLSFFDNTADPGVATDLAAIKSADSDWYGLLLDSNGTLEVEAAAAWAEANGPCLFGYNTTDTACADPASTTDLMYLLKASAYARTYGLYSPTELLSYSAAGLMGNRFPFDPGSDTWAFKTIAGVTVDNINGAAIHAVENKNGNVYTAVAGLNVTQFGKSPGGEFIDTTRFIDWFQAEMQISVFGLLANNAKIPYTDSGIDAIRSTMLGVIQEGIDAGGIAKAPAAIVTLPLAAAANPLDKAARRLNKATFSAPLAGAIHVVNIEGSLQV